jgi:hypothetical protein
MEFQSHRTPDYDAAVNALKKLDWDSKTRAFAEASQPYLGAEATKTFGRSARNRSWRPIVGQKPADGGDGLPGDDHAELRMGENPVYVSHPYHLSLDQLREIVKVCDEHGLEVEIDTRSWYFPGRTLRVSYSARSN